MILFALTLIGVVGAVALGTLTTMAIDWWMRKERDPR